MNTSEMLIHEAHGEWDGTPAEDDPDGAWICDTCGARIEAEGRDEARQYLADAAAADVHSSDREPQTDVRFWEER